MRTKLTAPASVAAVFVVGLLSSGGLIRGGDTGATNPFYVAHMDPGNWPGSLSASVSMVKALGYDGMGTLWLEDLPGFLQACDSVGLKVPQIYLNVDFTMGQIGETGLGGATFDPRLKQDLPLLKGRGVQLICFPYGFKPSEPTAYARAIQIIREIADLVGTDTQVLLNNMDGVVSLGPRAVVYRVEVEEAFRLAEDTGRPNVGIMFDLVSYLRASKSHDYRPLLARALPRLKAVAVVGTDEFPVRKAYGRYHLKPLGQGSFDMFSFFRTLRELGYKGPILLETEYIDGDRESVLKESMDGWRKLQVKLNGKP